MIPIQFDKPWEMPLDERAEAVRKFSPGLVVEVADDVAAAAIASGVARPLRDLPEHVEREIAKNARFLSDLDSGVDLDEALARLEGDAAVDQQDGEPAPAAAPAAEAPRRKAHKAKDSA